MGLEDAEAYRPAELSAGIKHLVDGPSCFLIEADIRTGRFGLWQCKSSRQSETLALVLYVDMGLRVITSGTFLCLLRGLLRGLLCLYAPPHRWFWGVLH